MAMPFLASLTKPMLCAMADRQQAHKKYLIGSILIMALGYGSLSIAPFFPEVIKNHGRLVWYADIVSIVVGYTAFGVAWSIGDALAVNAARMNGVPWGSYRAWATAAWGIGGLIAGQLNELPFLPKFVPAFLLQTVTLLIEAMLLACWPNADFQMDGADWAADAAMDHGFSTPTTKDQQVRKQDSWAHPADLESVTGARQFNGGTLGSGSVRMNPKMVGAVANIFLEDIKSSLTLNRRKRGGLSELLAQHQLSNPLKVSPSLTCKTTDCSINSSGGGGGGINKLEDTLALNRGKLEAAKAKEALESSTGSIRATPPLPPPVARSRAASPCLSSMTNQNAADKQTTWGKEALRRTQLALGRLNSLSAAGGHVIVDDLHNSTGRADSLTGGGFGADCAGCKPVRSQVMMMSSLASSASMSKAAAARALMFQQQSAINGSQGESKDSATFSLDSMSKTNSIDSIELQKKIGTPSLKNSILDTTMSSPTTTTTKPGDDLQLVLLKLIIKRDMSVLKFLLMFVLFGLLVTIHLTYFFIHVEKICRQHGHEFSYVSGGYLACHSISEVICFIFIVPFLIPKVGRSGGLICCSLVFFVRYAYYGTYLEDYSPYWAMITECCHGLAYGIVYSLITEVALDCVNRVDDYLPELIERKIVDPDIDPNVLKLPLRATMQGIFSGAFDGLGNGLGCLTAGVFLDYYSFTSLWQACALLSLAIMIIYPLTELPSCLSRRREERQSR